MKCFVIILYYQGIATCSGFASVYTEKVIKKARQNNNNKEKKQYGLAHMQCQLAVVSLFILGIYAMIIDSKAIREKVSIFCDL